jgi:4'-phosphopantetheinyl transferase
MSASRSARATADGAAAGWAPGPAEPVLADAAVHVWRVDLCRVDDSVAESLSVAERARMAKLVSGRHRRLSSRSRGVLRQLLARYLRDDAHALELTVGVQGKPELGGARAGARTLHFNLSHSRHLALYAFAVNGPVGVDVQFARDQRSARATDYVALATRSFGEHAARTLAALDDESREREFLRLWTRYEAELKLLGVGIGAASSQRAAGATRELSIVELDVAADAAAALALGWRASELRRWDWA